MIAPNTAAGVNLDWIAESITGLTRIQGETDAAFRRRLSSSLTLDEDARFADKVEAAIKEWDAEEEKAEL